VEVVASLTQGRTAAAQCGLFIYKSVPVIFEPPCIWSRTTESLTVCTSGLHRIPSVNPQGPKRNLDLNLNLAMSGLLVTYRQSP